MKKILATAMSAILLVSAVLPISAEDYIAMADIATDSIEPSAVASNSSKETGSKEMEEAIIKVRTRIDIPEGYEFGYFSSYMQYGQTVYSLSWERTDGIYGSVNVNIMGDVILNYYSNSDFEDSGNRNAHFANMSVNSLYNKASAFIKAINPDIYKNIEIDKDSYSSYIGGTNASFSLARKENGIPVSNNTGYISMNKDTGEISNFNISWVSGFNGKDPAKILTQEQIKSQYSKLVGLEPYYSIVADNDGNQKAVLMYGAKNNSVLDAFTGKISTFNSGYYNGTDATATDDMDMVNAEGDDDFGSAGGAKREIQLTAAEKKAVEIEKNLLSAEKAAQIIFDDKYNAINQSNMVLRNSYLNSYGKDNEEYSWALYFEQKADGENAYSGSSAHATVNAKTGEIMSFYDYGFSPYYYTPKENEKFVEKTADANVNAALKSYLGDKFSEYKLSNSEITFFNYSYYMSSITPKANDNIETGKSYSYTRYVNGIKVTSDMINVQTDINGNLTSFSCGYSNVEFPSTKKMLTEEKALQSLYKKQDLTISYSYNISNEGVVTSALLYSMPSFYLDALTGKLVNWDGSELAGKTGYSDIDEHSVKSIAEKLMQNGISLPAIDGKLMPDSKITEEDFIRLLSNIYTDWNDFYYVYQKKLSGRDRIVDKVTGQTSQTSSLSQTITRQDAVKCFVTALGGRRFAEMKDVYKSPYKDVTEGSEYAGYFAIADSLKITKANSDGKINPKNTITRAQALRMVYNYLNSN